MTPTLFAALIWFFAPQGLSASLMEAERALTIQFDASQQKGLKKNLERGIEVRNVFLVKLCERRSYWADECGKEGRVIHRVKYDPLSESYRVAEDFINDKQDAFVSTYATVEEAIATFSRVAKFPIHLMGSLPKKTKTRNMNDVYVRVRLVGTTKENRSVLEWVPYIVSFGLIDFDEYDTGWVEFSMKTLRG